MKIVALVVAAGRGARAGGKTPKQYQPVAGLPVLRRTLGALLSHPRVDLCLPVIHPGDQALYDASTSGLAEPGLLPPVPGGADRRDSVRLGLEALEAHTPELVLIHDAARPFLAPELVDRVLDALATHPGALPALPIVDALWREEEGLVAASQPRENLWRAQTPQGFRFDAILAAHRAAAGPADDDVAIARAAGLAVAVVPGDGNNFKITLPGDFARAERLAREAMETRTGTGFDVHAFGPGDALTLCGVEIPFGRGLRGHSDADVGMHALTDALFGALAEGDIGQWFPPTDPQWKGAASRVFLEKAMERVAARGFRVANLDVTLICEAPKIGPHVDDMRAALAGITGVEQSRISVKATTTERLGFAGRGEGIAALATATLVSA